MPKLKAKYRVGERVNISPLIVIPPFLLSDSGVVVSVSPPRAGRTIRTAWGRSKQPASEARYLVRTVRGPEGWLDESALSPA